ncbi:hypothetical protein HZA55_03015 [Candidatus Poribacteria bacterium]|nr:hypothetical protein [Candidatus Poribacteria bacterium]
MADLSLLMDFYGALLTEHQREILMMWCNQDLSLGEIAKNLGLTRQAVYDMVKRSQKKLYYYEDKLHLAKNKR